MLEIKMVNFDALTEDQQEIQPDNGSGKDCANYLRLTHGGETVAIFSDAMEPEDCVFYRDLEWVKGAIEMAYELGKQDC